LAGPSQLWLQKKTKIGGKVNRWVRGKRVCCLGMGGSNPVGASIALLSKKSEGGFVGWSGDLRELGLGERGGKDLK